MPPDVSDGAIADESADATASEAGKRAEASADDRSWAHLDRLKVGRYGEYFAKMALVRAGYDVYAPEVDDKAIDLIVRIPESPPRYLDVQVKAVRTAKPTYVFLRKRHFILEANRFLALVLMRDGTEPDLYMIPASVWREPQAPFASRDYEGLKSEAGFGLTISPATVAAIEPYRLVGRNFERLMAVAPAPDSKPAGLPGATPQART